MPKQNLTHAEIDDMVDRLDIEHLETLVDCLTDHFTQPQSHVDPHITQLEDDYLRKNCLGNGGGNL